jgi:trehalose/maltose hydrolase-like predicted phosphorylase
MSVVPPSPYADPAWFIVEEGFDLAREHEVESILTICNGYLGIRASIAESGSFSRPSTFIAGIYVTDEGLGPRLAVFPAWLHVEVSVEGQLLSFGGGRVLEHRRFLDLRQGVLWRNWRQQDPSGRITRLTYLHIASLADRHVIVQSIAATAENYSGRISLVGCPTKNARSDTLATVDNPNAMLVRGSEVVAGIATDSELHDLATSTTRGERGGVQDGVERWSWEASFGETMRLDRIICVFTSHDVVNPVNAASDHVTSTCARNLLDVIQAHVDTWRRRWDAAGVRIVGDDLVQRALHFAVYHLIAAANSADERISIGARGLTGDAYRGHIFWDTEIYMLPFYVFTDPPTARSLLMYRYHTLDAARRKAKAHGYKGALYAWESADTGDEVTPRTVVAPDGKLINILTGECEHHISADVAYAIWQYWRATGDDSFMVKAGAEILADTARFWASRAQVDSDGRAHIRQVIGPDEYHEMVDDDAYTNTMAALNLERAADAMEILRREQTQDWPQLSARLGLTEKEPDSWRELATKVTTGFDPATNLIEQFAGYFQLEEVDVAAFRRSTVPIDVLLGAERTQRSKVVKQADVVALSALVWEKWPIMVHDANFRYYEPRTAHGSSLSPAFYALVAARLGDTILAQAYLRQVAEIDLANNMGNAAGGVHMGALGGLWQAAVFGAAGLVAREDGIAVDPHLLPGWSEIAFPVQWRGRSLRLRIEADPKRIEISVETGDNLTLAIRDGPACIAGAGRRYAIRSEPSGWAEWEQISQ